MIKLFVVFTVFIIVMDLEPALSRHSKSHKSFLKTLNFKSSNTIHDNNDQVVELNLLPLFL